MSQQPEQAVISNWKRAVSTVLAAIQQGRISPGELAELRRVRPEDASSPAFWRILVRFVDPHDPPPRAETHRLRWEQRWAVILGGMARLAHAPGRPLGRVLAEAGFHELRLRRLLRASGVRLWDEFRAAVEFLSAKGERLDWEDAASLVLSDPETAPDWADQVRRRIARSFFGALFSQGKKR
ncbi:MAG: type I-E CRISPR-associated protein Cse2/CasB [Deltaproteobacteria bacterium]|nr:type I-E CRISPR-associated protein Cse2/CasB [Deltaproteobacteria bacterium]